MIRDDLTSRLQHLLSMVKSLWLKEQAWETRGLAVGREQRVPRQRARALWREIGAVLIVVAVTYPFDLTSLFRPSLGDSSVIEFSLRDIVHDVPLIALLLFFIWRSREPWARFGLTHPRLVLDTGIFLAIFLARYWVVPKFVRFVALSLHLLGIDLFWGQPGGSAALFAQPASLAEYALWVPGILISAFSQELLMRGYLIPRFEQVFGSTKVSILLTALLFGAVHLYQGPRGVLSATVSGLAYGLTFCLTRRLWPIAATHAAYNFLVLLR